MNENFLVTKSNYFIMNSSYDLSLEEQKIILTLASMVQPEDEDFKPYNFRIADFMQLLGITDKSKYTEVPKITKELMKKVFEIQEGKKLIQTAWLSSAVYEKGTGYVELTFSSYLKPYMLKLNSMFTQYKLANILSMKSKYSPRVYEILKCNQFKKQGHVEIEVDELRKLIKAENIYPKYNDFKRYVIVRTQKELSKISDISFDFEEIKTGRKVTSLKFYIHSNKLKANKEPKAIDEVSASVAETNPNVQEGIEVIVSMMKEHNITPAEAIRIYKSANGNLDIIKKVYEDKRNKQSNDFVGLIISLVKPGAYMEPKKTFNKSNFTNYDQRAYDGSDGGLTIDQLERKLLRWDTQEDNEDEKYQQEKMIME